MLDESRDAHAIERRIHSVAAVRQVLQAVWALARAQLPLAEEAAAEATRYLDGVDAVVDRLAGSPSRVHTRETLYVVLGPERPYAGALPRQIAAQIPSAGLVGIVGLRLHEATRNDATLTRRICFVEHGAATHEEPEAIAATVAGSILEHSGQRHVELLHPMSGGPTLRSTVLLAGEREAVPARPETYSPWRTVLQAALAEAITGRIAVGLAEALRSEVRARMTAADRARGAADRKLETLAHDLRAARQRRITDELLEVVAGRQTLLATGAAPGSRAL